MDRALEVARAPQQGLGTLGEQLAFYARVLAWVPRTAVHYPKETLRLLSDVFFGSGALAVIGGTLGVMIGMTVFTGLIVGLQGYSALKQLGAMRISEEIDALEVMAVPSVPYLVTTRVLAAVGAVIPLYVVGLLCSY